MLFLMCKSTENNSKFKIIRFKFARRLATEIRKAPRKAEGSSVYQKLVLLFSHEVQDCHEVGNSNVSIAIHVGIARNFLAGHSV